MRHDPIAFGDRFYRWSVVGPTTVRNHRTYVPVRCECGAERSVLAQALLCSDSKSCGCLKREVAARTIVERTTTHGQSRRGAWSSEYSSWARMWERVRSSSPKNAPYYRDRGITVCERRKSFEAFLEDMGSKPGPGLSLDRKDNDLGYCKSNCRWATASQQRLNQRRITRKTETAA